MNQNSAVEGMELMDLWLISPFFWNQRPGFTDLRDHRFPETYVTSSQESEGTNVIWEVKSQTFVKI